MKFMGKREIGQLSLFDFVVILLIADFVVVGMENNDTPFYMYIIGIFILGLIQKLLAKLMLKIPKLRSLFDGTDSIIVFDGKINLKEMAKQSYNFDDLISQLRLKNVRSLSEVQYVILEPNGKISVFKKESNGMEKEIFPFPLIVSGKVIEKNLKILKLNKSWLYEQIRKQGYESFQDIYYANYEDQSLFIVETCDF
jgi:uncharacterized membrane protein YcaP (DUF421 family)